MTFLQAVGEPICRKEVNAESSGGNSLRFLMALQSYRSPYEYPPGSGTACSDCASDGAMNQMIKTHSKND